VITDLPVHDRRNFQVSHAGSGAVLGADDRCQRAQGVHGRQRGLALDHWQHGRDTHVRAKQTMAADVGQTRQDGIGIGVDVDRGTQNLTLLPVIAFDLVGVVGHHRRLEVQARNHRGGHVAAANTGRIALVAILNRDGVGGGCQGQNQGGNLQG